MTIAHLLTGFLLLIAGIVLSYRLLPKTQEPTSGQKVGLNFLLRSTGLLFRSMAGTVFILIAIMSILTFCLGVDGGNYTPEKEDDMTVLNGIIIGICSLSIESNIVYALQKLKTYRTFKKDKKQ
jgi:hypothetical protein